MYRSELYTEFSEDCTYMVTVDKTELLNKLKELNYGAIIENDYSTYRIYYSDRIKNNSNLGQDEEYHLKIDSAARVRFEGGLDEYEKLLEEMNSVAKSIYDSVVEYFRKAEVREKLQNIADVLVEREVIYDLEEFFEEKAEESISLDKKDEENA